jgi:hypothetical protein
MTVLKNHQRYERAMALATRARELVLEMEQLPKVPVVAFLSKEMRRQFRRFAARLRAGKVEPRYPNLFTAEELADICEQAANRDEFIENAVKELRQISDELQALISEEQAEFGQAATAELLQVKDAAQWYGPDSQAWDRYREIQRVRRHGQRERNRPRKPAPPQLLPLPGTDYDLFQRNLICAAEALPEGAPAGEPVLRFPEGAGDGRMVLRIGIGAASWVGAFKLGDTQFSTVQLMPDDRHLLVVAAGAGYLIDAVSHSLVSDLGSDIAVVVRHDASAFLIADHGGFSLEAFGPAGRIWNTGPIGCGGFRAFNLTDGVLSFEARRDDAEWIVVGMDLVTGEMLTQ